MSAVKPDAGEPDDEHDEYPGAVANLLKDVCDTAVHSYLYPIQSVYMLRYLMNPAKRNASSVLCDLQTLNSPSDEQGFAFGEMWTRPKKEVQNEDGNGVQVQWDYLLKYADITYTNFVAFPEARNLAGKLDEFKKA